MRQSQDFYSSPHRAVASQVILPEQLYALASDKIRNKPEAKLLFAVLEEAVETFQKGYGSGSKREKRAFDEAEAWFSSEEHKLLFSFLHICHVLELEPSYIRKGLLQWKLNKALE